MGNFTESLMGVHSNILRTELGHLYHLQASIDYFQTHPNEAARIFFDYASLFTRFFNLNQKELLIIDNAMAILNKNPHKSATEFRKRVSGHEDLLCDTVRAIADPGTTHYRDGVRMLTTMMTGAWDMKLDGLKPRDGDQRSDGVIWGHVLGAENQVIDLHFIPAHLTERILTIKLRGTPLEQLTTKKDWTFALSTTMVGLDGVRNIGAGSRLLPVWRLPRPKGLGWIREDEIQTYKKLLR